MILKKKLFQEFNAQGATVNKLDDLDSMKTITTAFIRGYVKNIWPKLPKNLVIVNLVGTLLDGLSTPGSTIRIVQDQLIRTQLTNNLGANDGYIEYPGTMVPSGVGRKSVVLVANASHNFLDGSFERLDFNSQGGLEKILSSVLSSLSEELAP